MKKTLIIGANSAIAQATARHLAKRGDAIYLLGRDDKRLADTAEDLKARGAAQVQHAVSDALDGAGQQAAVDNAIEALGELDCVLIAYGTLPNQTECQDSVEDTRKEFEINAISIISLLTGLANYFERRGSGTIAVITSVAGDRGRQSNYVYGAAKAAVAVFLQGLRNRLHPAGVQVLTVKPGFVDTPMTREFNKGPLWASPDDVAQSIVRGLDKGADVIYAPWFWRYIMLVITAIPELVFKRLKL